MTRANNYTKFLNLRKEYPQLVFESYDFKSGKESIEIEYRFSLSGKYIFTPRISIPVRQFFIKDNYSERQLDSFIFNAGMIELLSYWKATCSPAIIIKPFSLNMEQINWWKKLYFYGLGEFFYLNSIDAEEDNFVEIYPDSEQQLKACVTEMNDSTIIPVGGGKDSVVTLDLLSQTETELHCLIINPRRASIECAIHAGFGKEEIIEIRREIHPLLPELNERGFLNGHTPFSAALAFWSLLASRLTGSRHIALSNESSANEPTVNDTKINHQYSKSFEFEQDFRYYANKYILRGINYYSLLRPLNELQIAKFFSTSRSYFRIFKSCNAGSKTDRWCCNCAKCLFTYIILSPFISEPEMIEIFGGNLLDNPELLPLFNELTGISDIKPFDCVGTLEEINAALCMTISSREKKDLPFLLKYFKETEKYINCKGFYKNRLMQKINPHNNLKSEQIQLLKNKLNIT